MYLLKTFKTSRQHIPLKIAFCYGLILNTYSTDCMQLSSCKTWIIAFTRKQMFFIILIYLERTLSETWDNVVSKFLFHTQVGHIISQSLGLLSLKRTAAYCFPTLERFWMFYLNTGRTKLQFASTVRKFIPSNDSKRAEALCGSSSLC